MNGWGSVRLEEERAAFRNERSTRLKTSDIGNWEQYNVLTLWSKTRARRCLRGRSVKQAVSYSAVGANQKTSTSRPEDAARIGKSHKWN